MTTGTHTARRLTALQKIADMSTTSGNAARRARDAGNANHQSYREGEVMGLTDAYKIMKAELARLKNLHQNGSLSVSDFDQL